MMSIFIYSDMLYLSFEIVHNGNKIVSLKFSDSLSK